MTTRGVPKGSDALGRLAGPLRAGYRQYWFYISPTKLVIRRKTRDFFRARPPCDRVLEVGGGTGMMRSTLEEACRARHVISSDLDPTDATEVACDAQALPFPDGRFDVVAAFELLEHVPDTNRLLEEIRRVTKPGGHIVVSVPFLFGVHDYQDFYRFTEQGLMRVLAQRGLPVEEMARSGGICFTIVNLLVEYLRTVGLPHPDAWRSHGKRRTAQLALTSILTAPLMLLSWLAFCLDALIDRNSRNPAGLVVIATRDPSAHAAWPAADRAEGGRDGKAASTGSRRSRR